MHAPLGRGTICADKDAISIAGEALDRPNQMADDGISRFLLSHLDAEIEPIEAEETLETMVQGAVSRALSNGVPRMREIARRLGMSERTLQRRLADEGLSFKAVVDATRRQLAENLLQQSRYTLSEVAFLSGFSEQSAFQRAFKRWVGKTPTEYRDESPVRKPSRGHVPPP